ncbi:MAG: molecular chaperone TorD family protein [Myxococcales bacterium]|nr:molecular chaperone TorD family protein [Myxococcales bacterium]
MMEAQGRANLYGFFSRLFIRELDDEAVALLAGPLGQDLLPEATAAGDVALAADPARRHAELDPDYTHITVVNVVPYASFYLRDDAMVEGGTANPAAEFLKEYGFEVDLVAARSLSQDHIGIVLESMAVLANAEAEAAARPDPAYAARIRQVQRTFLQDHLLSWAPVYLYAVERCAHSTLYREAASVLMDFLGSDAQDLEAEA